MQPTKPDQQAAAGGPPTATTTNTHDILHKLLDSKYKFPIILWKRSLRNNVVGLDDVLENFYRKHHKLSAFSLRCIRRELRDLSAAGVASWLLAPDRSLFLTHLKKQCNQEGAKSFLRAILRPTIASLSDGANAVTPVSHSMLANICLNFLRHLSYNTMVCPLGIRESFVLLHRALEKRHKSIANQTFCTAFGIFVVCPALADPTMIGHTAKLTAVAQQNLQRMNTLFQFLASGSDTVIRAMSAQDDSFAKTASSFASSAQYLFEQLVLYLTDPQILATAQKAVETSAIFSEARVSHKEERDVALRDIITFCEKNKISLTSTSAKKSITKSQQTVAQPRLSEELIGTSATQSDSEATANTSTSGQQREILPGVPADSRSGTLAAASTQQKRLSVSSGSDGGSSEGTDDLDFDTLDISSRTGSSMPTDVCYNPADFSNRYATGVLESSEGVQTVMEISDEEDADTLGELANAHLSDIEWSEMNIMPSQPVRGAKGRRGERLMTIDELIEPSPVPVVLSPNLGRPERAKISLSELSSYQDLSSIVHGSGSGSLKSAAAAAAAQQDANGTVTPSRPLSPQEEAEENWRLLKRKSKSDGQLSSRVRQAIGSTSDDEDDLLPRQTTTIVSPASKAISEPGANMRHRRQKSDGNGFGDRDRSVTSSKESASGKNDKHKHHHHHHHRHHHRHHHGNNHATGTGENSSQTDTRSKSSSPSDSPRINSSSSLVSVASTASAPAATGEKSTIKRKKSISKGNGTPPSASSLAGGKQQKTMSPSSVGAPERRVPLIQLIRHGSLASRDRSLYSDHSPTPNNNPLTSAASLSNPSRPSLSDSSNDSAETLPTPNSLERLKHSAEQLENIVEKIAFSVAPADQRSEHVEHAKKLATELHMSHADELEILPGDAADLDDGERSRSSTSTSKMVEVPEEFLQMRLTDALTGSETTLQDIMRASESGRVLVAFLRQFGDMFCRRRVVELLKLKPQLDALHVELVAVGLGSLKDAKKLMKEYGLTYHLLLDRSLHSYRLMHLNRGWRAALLNARTVRVIPETVRMGFRQGRVCGDQLQLGGLFVIHGNRIILAHADKFNGDTVDDAMLLAACTKQD